MKCGFCGGTSFIAKERTCKGCGTVAPAGRRVPDWHKKARKGVIVGASQKSTRRAVTSDS